MGSRSIPSWVSTLILCSSEISARGLMPPVHVEMKLATHWNFLPFPPEISKCRAVRGSVFQRCQIHGGAVAERHFQFLERLNHSYKALDVTFKCWTWCLCKEPCCRAEPQPPRLGPVQGWRVNPVIIRPVMISSHLPPLFFFSVSTLILTQRAQKHYITA